MAWNWEQARNLAVIAGVVVALLSLRTTVSLVRRKQSSDLVFAGRNDEKFIAGIRVFRSRAAGRIRDLAALESNCDDAANARYVLNYFEALAVGVRKKIYDEEILYLNYKTTLKHLMDAARPMIVATRRTQNVPSLYCEICWLAGRWQAAERGWFARTSIGWSWARTLHCLSRGRHPVAP